MRQYIQGRLYDTFENFMEGGVELSGIAQQKDVVAEVRLGVRMMLEIMDNNDEELKNLRD